jgi:glycosyltransferase involved in cell wall biosynthesis
VVVADRGIMPELVENGVSGLVVKDTCVALADATLRYLRDPEFRATMGKAAREKAHHEFRLDRQVEDVERFYEKIINLGKWRRG